MAIMETKGKSLELSKVVSIICPVCKAQKQINLPISIIDDKKPITSVSISKDIICSHHFQFFMDKNFAIRGYQKVDYQINSKPEINEIIQGNNDEKLFKELVFKEKYIEYRPKDNLQNRDYSSKAKNLPKKMSKINGILLEGVYEEFWEFIEDNNEKFKYFIKNDVRRQNKIIPTS